MHGARNGRMTVAGLDAKQVVWWRVVLKASGGGLHFETSCGKKRVGESGEY